MTTPHQTAPTVQTLAARLASCIVATQAARAYDTVTVYRPAGPALVVDPAASGALAALTSDLWGNVRCSNWAWAQLYSCLSGMGSHEVTDGEQWQHEFADGCCDVYTQRLIQWLANDDNAIPAIEEAREDGLIGPDADIPAQIMAGQYVVLSRIASIVRGGVEVWLEELTEAEE